MRFAFVGGLGNTYKETVKMPEVGRWLFYPTFLQKQISFLFVLVFFLLFFFFFLFLLFLLPSGEADFLANSKSDELLLNIL